MAARASATRGGPSLAARTNTVVAVTPYGFNSQCGGVGGVYRIATDLALDWLAEFD
jgi:hypothetical protein